MPQRKAPAEKPGLNVQTMTLTITVEATESTMQRLAALMLLQDPTKPLPTAEELRAMPWETREPIDSPELDLDYAVVRAEVVKQFEKVIERLGQDLGRTQITLWLIKYDAKSLSQLSNQQLLDLHTDLEVEGF